MNCFFVSGRVITGPTSSFLKNDLFIVKFCISCSADYMYVSDRSSDKTDIERKSGCDFFQCVAFGDVAKQIAEYFDHGTKISMQTVLKNFQFKDSNGTPHFTNILLVNQVEYDDDKSQSFKLAPRKRNMDKVMVAELKTIDDHFRKVCEEGFLCIDESDYYNMAISNMVI